MEFTFAITGASGTIYAIALCSCLRQAGSSSTVNLIMSDTAATVAQVEMGVNLREPDAAKFNEWLGLEQGSKLIRYWRLDNFAAKPSSGSNKQAGMIIVPCSMGTHGCDRLRRGNKSYPSGGGRLPERRQKACPRPARNALQRYPSREYAAAHRTPAPGFCPQAPVFITGQKPSKNLSSTFVSGS